MQKYILSMMLLPLLIVAACNKDTKPPVSPEVTNVMVYNGSTAFLKKASNVFVDTAFIAARSYNDMGGAIGLLNVAAYSWVAPGRHRIGFTDTASFDKISERYEVLDKDKYYTFYLADSIGYYTILMSEDGYEGKVEDKSRIRLVHLSSDSGPVDFLIDTEKVAGLEGIAYKTITPFITVDPMSNPSFRIKHAGASEDDPHLIRKGFSLIPGRSYTFILRGYIQEKDNDPNTTINLSAIQNF